MTSTASTASGGSETLIQVKLTGEEWNGVEIMEPEDEMRILRLIIDGFHDVNRVFNSHQSLLSRLKITETPEMEDYLFDEYFRKRAERVIAIIQKMPPPTRKSRKPIWSGSGSNMAISMMPSMRWSWWTSPTTSATPSR
jgi:hypothetical protein